MRGRLRVLFVLLALALMLGNLNYGLAGDHCVTLNVSPNPAQPNQPITFSGSGCSGANELSVSVYVGTSCSGSAIVSVGQTALPTYSVTLASGLASGSYSARTQDFTAPDLSGCVPFTVQAAPPIPEYPIGLPLLAIFVVIGYGLIRRRTRN